MVLLPLWILSFFNSMQLSSSKLISHRDALDFSAPYSDSCWSEWCFSCKMHFCEQAYMRHTKIQNVYDKTWENTSIVNTLICFKINNFFHIVMRKRWELPADYLVSYWYVSLFAGTVRYTSVFDSFVLYPIAFGYSALELHYFGLAPRMNVLGKNILFRDWMRFFLQPTLSSIHHLWTQLQD